MAIHPVKPAVENAVENLSPGRLANIDDLLPAPFSPDIHAGHPATTTSSAPPLYPLPLPPSKHLPANQGEKPASTPSSSWDSASIPPISQAKIAEKFHKQEITPVIQEKKSASTPSSDHKIHADSSASANASKPAEDVKKGIESSRSAKAVANQLQIPLVSLVVDASDLNRIPSSPKDSESSESESAAALKNSIKEAPLEASKTTAVASLGDDLDGFLLSITVGLDDPSSRAASESGDEPPVEDTGSESGYELDGFLLSIAVGLDDPSSRAATESGDEPPVEDTGSESGYDLDGFLLSITVGLDDPSSRAASGSGTLLPLNREEAPLTVIQIQDEIPAEDSLPHLPNQDNQEPVESTPIPILTVNPPQSYVPRNQQAMPEITLQSDPSQLPPPSSTSRQRFQTEINMPNTDDMPNTDNTLTDHPYISRGWTIFHSLLILLVVPVPIGITVCLIKNDWGLMPRASLISGFCTLPIFLAIVRFRIAIGNFFREMGENFADKDLVGRASPREAFYILMKAAGHLILEIAYEYDKSQRWLVLTWIFSIGCLAMLLGRTIGGYIGAEVFGTVWIFVAVKWCMIVKEIGDRDDTCCAICFAVLVFSLIIFCGTDMFASIHFNIRQRRRGLMAGVSRGGDRRARPLLPVSLR